MRFTCDPYQSIDKEFQLTRKAIQALHSCNINVMILTKGGMSAERDFDLSTQNDWFGITLTNLDDSLSLKWELGAALTEERINSQNKAHDLGIRTWVSLEPALYPEVTLDIIKRTHTFVDKFKVGVLNHHPHAGNIDWKKFAQEVRDLLIELNSNYYLKDDLRKWLNNDNVDTK